MKKTFGQRIRLTKLGPQIPNLKGRLLEALRVAPIDNCGRALRRRFGRIIRSVPWRIPPGKRQEEAEIQFRVRRASAH